MADKNTVTTEHLGLIHGVYTTTPNWTIYLTRPGMTTVFHSGPIANTTATLNSKNMNFSLREIQYKEIPKILFDTITTDLLILKY